METTAEDVTQVRRVFSLLHYGPLTVDRVMDLGETEEGAIMEDGRYNKVNIGGPG